MYVFSINTEENAFLINYHSKILYFSVELEMKDKQSQSLNSYKVLRGAFNSNALSKCKIMSNTIIHKGVKI